MKLESVTAVIRPRGAWESADLGCALVRTHYPRLMAIWALTVVPIWAAIFALLWRWPLAAIGAVWLLQPLYARPQLLYLSRVLFGERPGIWAVVKAAPKLWLASPIYSLTIGRLSLSRGLLAPAILLERPKWRDFGARARVLKAGGADAFGLTITASLLQTATLFAFGFLVKMVLSAQIHMRYLIDLIELFALIAELAEYGMTREQLLWFYLIYLASITLIEPFYMGAGFGQYIDARTHLEGWDVELGFKRIAGRLERMRGARGAVGLATAALLFAAAPNPARAAPYHPETPEESIAEVLGEPEFEIHEHTRTVRVRRGQPDSGSGAPNLGGLAALGELLFWMVVIGALVGLGLLIYHNREAFTRKGNRSADDPPAKKARTVLGMDIAEETLPKDIAGAAWEAFLDGDVAKAMRLLYRGSLSWLVEREGLPVRESDTEGDCIAHSRSMPDPNRIAFFSDLTATWTAFAYGGAPPEKQQVERLCQNWPFDLRRKEAAP